MSLVILIESGNTIAYLKCDMLSLTLLEDHLNILLFCVKVVGVSGSSEHCLYILFFY